MEPLGPDGETQNHTPGCSSLFPGTSRGSLIKPGIRAPESCSACLPPSSGLEQVNERFEGQLRAPSSDTHTGPHARRGAGLVPAPPSAAAKPARDEKPPLWHRENPWEAKLRSLSGAPCPAPAAPSANIRSRMRAQSTTALCPASLFWLGVSFPTTPRQLGCIQSTDTNFGNSYNEEKKAFLFGMAHSRAGQAEHGWAWSRGPIPSVSLMPRGVWVTGGTSTAASRSFCRTPWLSPA